MTKLQYIRKKDIRNQLKEYLRKEDILEILLICKKYTDLYLNQYLTDKFFPTILILLINFEIGIVSMDELIDYDAAYREYFKNNPPSNNKKKNISKMYLNMLASKINESHIAYLEIPVLVLESILQSVSNMKGLNIVYSDILAEFTKDVLTRIGALN